MTVCAKHGCTFGEPPCDCAEQVIHLPEGFRMSEITIADQLTAHTDDAANHIALLKTLQHFGILNDQMVAHYTIERPIAKQHVVALAGLVAMAVGLMDDGAEPDDIKQMLTELGMGSVSEALKKAEDSLEYLYFTGEEKGKLRAMLDAFRDLES